MFTEGGENFEFEKGAKLGSSTQRTQVGLSTSLANFFLKISTDKNPLENGPRSRLDDANIRLHKDLFDYIPFGPFLMNPKFIHMTPIIMAIIAPKIEKGIKGFALQ